MARVKDYYQLLGVGRDATEEDIRRAFRKLAMEWHPDRNRTREAEERFKEVNEAYQVLVDPERRRAYDRYGRVDLGRDGGFSGRGFEGFDFPGGVGDIFDAFFGGFGARQETGPRRGADLHFTLEVSFKDAALGAEREVDLLRAETCATCRGSRSAPGTYPVGCRDCRGAGKVRRTSSNFFGQFVQVVTCKACQGEGRVVQDPCPDCKGAGRSRHARRIGVSIPAGIEDGMQLRLAGEGEAGLLGGPAGDLYVTVSVRPHPLFRREKSNLVADLPVNLAQAALGATLEVPLLDGTTERVEVPGGVQPDTVIRVKGKGVPSVTNGKRGDLLLRVQVVTPQHPGPRTRRLLEELAQALEEETEPGGQRSWLERLKEALKGEG